MKDEVLVVYLIPPEKKVNGGILSIFSQANESRNLLPNASVKICTYPSTSTYKYNDLFKNNEVIYTLLEVLKNSFSEKLILHIPENAVIYMQKQLRKYSYYDELKKFSNVHINVMTQNIQLLPNMEDFVGIFGFANLVTQTTAHDRYATQKLATDYQTPVKHLSVYCDPTQYNYVEYEEKQNIIIYSPDDNPNKESIIKTIRQNTNYELVEIKNLSYEKYKELQSIAKFSLSFGEGFDGYFIESYFSGGIGISVYNDNFFPSKEYRDGGAVCNSYSELEDNIVDILKILDKRTNYTKTNKFYLSRISKLYSYKNYINNIKDFYDHKFTYVPDFSQSPIIKIERELIEITIKIERLELENQQLTKYKEQNEERLKTLKSKVRHLERIIESVESSVSWKATKPLRIISSKLTSK